jgi:hypothetical protein
VEAIQHHAGPEDHCPQRGESRPELNSRWRWRRFGSERS